jgi:hypothetical protein
MADQARRARPSLALVLSVEANPGTESDSSGMAIAEHPEATLWVLDRAAHQTE